MTTNAARQAMTPVTVASLIATALVIVGFGDLP